MAQPSVAREPSMEEILASIRQIIESNEPGAGRALSNALPPVYAAEEDERASDIHLTVDQAYAAVEFPEPVSQPDPRFVAANSAGSAPPAEAPERAMSLADVAARVRAASERNTAQLRETPPAFRQTEVPTHMFEAPQPAVELQRPAVEPTPVVAPAPIVAPAPQALVEQPVPTYEEVAPVAASLPPVEVASAAPVAEPVVDAIASALSNELLPQVASSAQQSLMSADTGLQITRSFEELVAAIDGVERRSLDEIAEDMLRPMLREWLDDNLPTLVERLVREEIERVARGPRR